MPVLSPSHDPLGKALLDFLDGDTFASVETWSDAEGFDNLPASKFFRSRVMMPPIERKALEHCQGKTLDAGAGAGSHSLELQKQLSEVTAMDISPGACDCMRRRGVKKVIHADFMEYAPSEGEQYDTILMLMNGIGICGSFPGFQKALAQVDKLLAPGGQLIFDSADVMYMYREEEGGQYLDMSKNYYGETTYWMAYEEKRGKEFGWLFIDFESACKEAAALGFEGTKLLDDDFYAYLARFRRRRDFEDEK